MAAWLVVGMLGVGAVALGWGRVVSGASGGGRPLDASAFAPGACMAFAPTAGNRGETVFLDAGHGGIDPGGVGTTESGRTITEATETLRVELDAMSLLRADGFRVVVSRTANSTVVRLRPTEVSNGELSLRGAHDDVAARDVCANLAKANVLVGIYLDASGVPQTAGSLTAYDSARPFAASDMRLANLLQRDVLNAMNARGWGIPDDGVLSDSGLGSSSGNPADGGLAAQSAAYDHLLLIGPAEAGYFSTPSEMPGAVIEPLYITDPLEGTIADSSAGQKVIAGGIAAAVETFLRAPRG
ncbi:MAG: N-acetylmuramoyl-L-alanine amidase [Solirubrobacteraceae bacterium]|jgi:N-acetylmuramoyl-L-alanine amidase